MTIEQAIQIREFSEEWIKKVVSKQKRYQGRLIECLRDFIPEDENWDSFDILRCENWDYGESYIDYYQNTRSWPGLGDRVRQLIEWDNIYGFTNKAQTDFICTLRVAVDLLIEQSGGVVGYTVGDLKKVFDGNIPEYLLNKFENPDKILKASDSEPIWL